MRDARYNYNQVSLCDDRTYSLSVDVTVVLARYEDLHKTCVKHLNFLTPNVNYSGRTAPLTSKVVFYIFIQ